METVHGQSLKEVRTPNPLSRADVDALLAWLEANLPEPPDWLLYADVVGIGGTMSPASSRAGAVERTARWKAGEDRHTFAAMVCGQKFITLGGT